MDRKQFAAVTAEAYVNQFAKSGRRMMQPCITYSPSLDVFEASSALALRDDDIVVCEIEPGQWGDIDADDPSAEDAIRDYLANENDDLWAAVREIIAEAIDD